MGTFSVETREAIYWLNKSQELRNAAACVWSSLKAGRKTTVGEESFDAPNHSSYFMLCGMSLESMLKAILVQRHQQLPDHHHLDKLAQLIDLPFDARELDLLKILSATIIWEGKYPVPWKEKDWDTLIELQDARLFHKIPSGKTQILTPNDELNWASYSSLWERVFTEFAMTTEGWTKADAVDSSRR